MFSWSIHIKNHAYYALDFTFLACNYETTRLFKSLNDTIEHDDTITVKRRTATLSFKYGIQYSYKHIVLDINVGLGL